MRFLVIVKASKESEAGQLPTGKELAEMGKFNQELVNAGVMLSGEGLRPSSKGTRINFGGGKPSVVDGPFAETKELVGGFWILEVKSHAECVEWIKRAPFKDGSVEIRQIAGADDFAASDPTGELRKDEERLRKAAEKNGRNR